MKSKEECLEALAQGKTLVNITGGEVHLDKFGYQVKANIGKARKGRDFRFSNPSLWHIKRVSCNSMLFLFSCFILVCVLIITTYLLHHNNNNNDIDSIIKENSDLFQEITQANKENSILIKKLQKYEADAEYIMSLGASEDEAIKIIKASEVYNVDPK